MRYTHLSLQNHDGPLSESSAETVLLPLPSRIAVRPQPGWVDACVICQPECKYFRMYPDSYRLVSAAKMACFDQKQSTPAVLCRAEGRLIRWPVRMLSHHAGVYKHSSRYDTCS